MLDSSWTHLGKGKCMHFYAKKKKQYANDTVNKKKHAWNKFCIESVFRLWFYLTKHIHITLVAWQQAVNLFYSVFSLTFHPSLSLDSISTLDSVNEHSIMQPVLLHWALLRGQQGQRDCMWPVGRGGWFMGFGGGWVGGSGARHGKQERWWLCPASHTGMTRSIPWAWQKVVFASNNQHVTAHISVICVSIRRLCDEPLLAKHGEGHGKLAYLPWIIQQRAFCRWCPFHCPTPFMGKRPSPFHPSVLSFFHSVFRLVY